MSSLDTEFREVARRIAAKFADLINVKIAAQRLAAIRAIEDEIEELDFIISGIEERARLEPKYINEARQLRRERDQIVNELNRYRSSEGTQRWQAAVASEQDYRNRAAVDDSVHRQLQLGTQILEQGSQTLARTHNLALETERIGVDTAAELGVQREKLERSRDRLQDTNIELGLGHRVIQRLRCGVLQSRLLLLIIIGVELGILAAVIALKIVLKK